MVPSEHGLELALAPLCSRGMLDALRLFELGA
jgi:hypothetical protein